MTPLLDAGAVAAVLGITRWRVYDLARAGILPAVRLGRTLRFDPDRLRAWIDAGGTAKPPDTDGSDVRAITSAGTRAGASA